jgi:hypothetical protein
MNAVKSKVSYRSFESEITDASFGNIAKFNCFGTILTNQNCTHEEIESRLISGMLPLSSVTFLFTPAIQNVELKL